MKLVQVTIAEKGVYFLYQIEVQRGIRGKTKSKVKELMIVGIPFKKVQDYCEQHKLVITNKAVYVDNDLEQPILLKEKDTLVYKEAQ